MQRLAQLLIMTTLSVFVYSASAHHSFAIYDLDNKTEIKGVLKNVTAINPHIIFTVETKDEEGNMTEWRIESMNPRRWDTFDFPDPKSIAEIGDEVSILGWKARNGDTEMALSTIITDDDEIVIRDEIRQGQGRAMGGMARAQEG